MASSRPPWPGVRVASRASPTAKARSEPGRRWAKGRLPAPDALVLRAFEAADGPTVIAWVSTDADARRWASLPRRPADAAIFGRWHADPGVRAYILTASGRPVAYGEIWEDPAEDEAELARLIVDPVRRGEGIGGALASALLAEARRLGWTDVWLRVVPDNDIALRAYTSAGFERSSGAEEAAFNAGQPVAYMWLRAPSSQGLGRPRA